MKFRRYQTAFLFLGLTVCAVHTAGADDREHLRRAPPNPTYQSECSACHVAYPPQLLPAMSWQQIMSDLPHHYGTDASLDPATTKTLTQWLTANSSSGTQPPANRITRSQWFLHEHDEISATTWKLPAVKSPANCSACHTQADQGDFSEHRIRIPR